MTERSTRGKNLEGTTYSARPARLIYVSPEFTCHGLSVITLGGTPGTDDSGAPFAENPLGGGGGADYDYADYGDYG